VARSLAVGEGSEGFVDELRVLLSSCVRKSAKGLYIDVKQALLSSQGGKMIARALLDRLSPGVVAVGGVGLGAALLVQAVVAISDLDGFVFRLGEKGVRQRLEGVLPPRLARVAIVMDVLMGEQAMYGAIAAEARSLIVEEVLAVVDRSPDDAPVKKRYRVESLFREEELLP